MVELENLTVGFHSHSPLISGINLSLGEGEIGLILGANGAGKSTLLRTIAGVQPPLGGVVRVGGEAMSSISPLERSRRAAYVPQEEFADFGWIVREFVSLGRAGRSGIFETAADRKVVEEVLRKCDALHLADRPLTQLSGGERQRVRIARGLVQEANVLILDEPTSQLDVSHVLSTLRLLQDLADSGHTLIVTLHDVNQAAGLRAKWVVVHDASVTVLEDRDQLLSSTALARAYGVEFELIDGRYLVATNSSPDTIGSM